MKNMILFNKPCLTGKEFDYIHEAIGSGQISGNGQFTKQCQSFLEKSTSAKKCLLTTSCTDALEMSAILARIEPGDEVIMPSFTFPSTANAFILRGAKIVFIDSRPDHPGVDERQIEAAVTERTKAIVPVHYAGVACDMDVIAAVATRHALFVIEDAAQAIDSFFIDATKKRIPLGSIGEFGTFSFHETKNIQAGEGGALLINRPEHIERSEIVWEKGTNRAAFWRGDVDKYGWVDIGSSFLPSELTAAFLYAQLEALRTTQDRRIDIWNQYNDGLQSIFQQAKLRAPYVPSFATNNGHMFYAVCESERIRADLIAFLRKKDIYSVFHYQSLHAAPYFQALHDGRDLPWADAYSSRLLRLPMHPELTNSQIARVVSGITDFFNSP
ncbi:MAG: dTDP-4-amino-4,6-dideoxygalactose transaminase [Kiritimatiellae bacterium]|nr:dTDP-4-amino-4,6-dideoxygalactose transaminase [Kiritimatiellia bacterium]